MFDQQIGVSATTVSDRPFVQIRHGLLLANLQVVHEAYIPADCDIRPFGKFWLHQTHVCTNLGAIVCHYDEQGEMVGVIF